MPDRHTIASSPILACFRKSPLGAIHAQVPKMVMLRLRCLRSNHRRTGFTAGDTFSVKHARRAPPDILDQILRIVFALR